MTAIEDGAAKIPAAVGLIFFCRARLTLFLHILFEWHTQRRTRCALISGINRFFSIVSKEGMRTAGDKSFLPQGTSTTTALRFLTLVLIFNTDTHNRKQATTVQSASKSASGSQMN
jgi:hypothetical protein